jgi:hypothetical protein
MDDFSLKKNQMKLLKDLPSEEYLFQKFNNPFADPPLQVNAHFHTPYSFSAFNTIDDIFIQAEKENIDVLGITDFITLDGYDEFFRLAAENRKFPLFNIEFMGLMQKEQEKGIKINDPNNPGRIYFCGKGLSYPTHINERQLEILANITENSLKQTEKMASLLNDHLKKIKAPFTLDFREIQIKYSKGLVRERHIAKALRINIIDNFKDTQKVIEFLNKLYGGKATKIDVNHPGAMDNELRSKLLKKGGVAFVEEDPTAFLTLDEIKQFILEAQGIPCYPVLLDDAEGNFTDYEKDFDALLRHLTRNRVYAVELIPGRNDISIVKDFVEVFNDKGFLITFGTEHNTLDQAPLKVSCRNKVPLDKDLIAVNYQSACVIAAHQYYIAKGKPGYLTPEGFPRLEKQDDFITIGNAVIRNFIEQ